MDEALLENRLDRLRIGANAAGESSRLELLLGFAARPRG